MDTHLTAFSELVGLVYATAIDGGEWPKLLDKLSEFSRLESDDQTKNPYSSQQVQEIVQHWDSPDPSGISGLNAQLAPHFALAREIQRQLVESERQEEQANRVLDWLPLGVAIVEPTGTLISANRRLRQIVQRSSSLSVTAGRLNSRPSSRLIQALTKVFDHQATGTPETVWLEEGSERLSLLVARLNDDPDFPQAVVWVATQEPAELEESSLRALYGMSAAEGRLTRQLAQGKTLEEASRALRVSINTVRSQLQSVFAKTGVSRQAELLHAIFSGPLWLDRGSGESPLVSDSSFAMTQEDGGMRLPDGRWLAWADLGDRDGYPLVFNHVITGTRRFRHPDLAVLSRAGLRLIMPERPGTGDSDPLADRTVQDWSYDVTHMVDHLGIKHFSVVGFSEGTPYALALANRLAERVEQVFIVSATPPIDVVEMFDSQVSIPFRSALFVAQRTPRLLPPLMRVMIRSARKNVYRFIEQMIKGMNAHDQAVFAEPGIRENYARGLMSAIAHGENHLVTETLLAIHGWKKADARITQPLHFFHGSHDWFYTLEGLREVTNELPQATLQVIPEGGHLLMYSHWHTIIPLIAQQLQLPDDRDEPHEGGKEE